MLITTKGYNVPTVTIEESLTPSTETVVGTRDDFQKLRDLAENSGLVRFKGKVSGNKMYGTGLANVDAFDQLELVFTTNYNDTPVVISVHVEDAENDQCVATLTVISLS